MNTSQANLTTLSAFLSNPLPSSAPDLAMERAELAMRELVDQARPAWFRPTASAEELAVRARFASSYAFERVLTPDVAQKERDAFAAYRNVGLYRRGRVRLEMLERIFKAATGSAFNLPDPSGMTSWIGDDITGLDVLIMTILTDADAEVIAAALRLLGQAAAPAAWFPRLHQERVMERLDVRTAEAGWTTQERRVLVTLSAQAQQRVVTELARSASEQLPSFPTGDASMTRTAPGRRGPWYASGWTWFAAALGVAGGGALASTFVGGRRGLGGIPNGRAKGYSPLDFNPAQLRRGTRHEMEHTKSRQIAQRIAMDHLIEDPLYYVKLSRMERG